MLTDIGLNSQKTTEIARKLDNLLATYQVFYQNLRGLHWNIKGQQFFELHAKFEEFYLDALTKIDEIAERILTLGKTPLHTFSDYLEKAQINEVKNVSEARASLEVVLNGLRQLLVLEREILRLSADAGDEGTNTLMSDYIREQEKTVWMLYAFLDSK